MLPNHIYLLSGSVSHLHLVPVSFLPSSFHSFLIYFYTLPFLILFLYTILTISFIEFVAKFNSNIIPDSRHLDNIIERTKYSAVKCLMPCAHVIAVNKVLGICNKSAGRNVYAFSPGMPMGVVE
jgi:hypothetical protein